MIKLKQLDCTNISMNNNTDIYNFKKNTSSLTTSKFSFSSSYQDIPNSYPIEQNLIDFTISNSNTNTITLLTNNTDTSSYSIFSFNTITYTSSLLITLSTDNFPQNSINNISTTNNINNLVLSGQSFSLISTQNNNKLLFRFPSKQTDDVNYNFINPKFNSKVTTVFSSFNTIDKTLYVFDIRKESPIFTIPLEIEHSEDFYGHFWNVCEGTQLFILTKDYMKVVDLRTLNKPILVLNVNVIDCVVLDNIQNNIKYIFLTSDNRILFYSRKLEELGHVNIDTNNDSDNLSFVGNSNIEGIRLQYNGDIIKGIDISYKDKVRINNTNNNCSTNEVVYSFNEKDNINEFEIKKLCLKKGNEEKNKDSELGIEIKELVGKYKEGTLNTYFIDYSNNETTNNDINSDINNDNNNDINSSSSNSNNNNNDTEELETSFFDSIATIESDTNTTRNNNFNTMNSNNINENDLLASSLSLLLLESDFNSIIKLIKETINKNSQITEEEKYKLKSLVYFVTHLTVNKKQSNKEDITFDRYYLEYYLNDQYKETPSYMIARLIGYYQNNKKEDLLSLLEPTRDNLLRLYNVIKNNNIELIDINSIIEKMIFINPIFSVAITLSIGCVDNINKCFIELIKKLQLRRRVKIEIVNLYNSNYTVNNINNTKTIEKNNDINSIRTTKDNKTIESIKDNKDIFEDVTDKLTISNNNKSKDNIDGLIQLDINKDKLGNNDIKKLTIATKKIYDLKLDTLENELINKLNDFIELVNDKNIKEADKIRTEIVKSYWKNHKSWLINLVTIMGILKKTISK